MIRRFFSRRFVKFIFVGLLNSIVGTFTMFFLYNYGGIGYWASTAIAYLIGSIISYILNKKYTFEYKGNGIGSIFRFAINIMACYLIAYSLAKPIIAKLLLDSPDWIKDNVSMMVGLALFTVLNYIGQNLFVFWDKK